MKIFNILKTWGFIAAIPFLVSCIITQNYISALLLLPGSIYGIIYLCRLDILKIIMYLTLLLGFGLIIHLDISAFIFTIILTILVTILVYDSIKNN